MSLFRNSTGNLVESLGSLVLSALDGMFLSPCQRFYEQMVLIRSSELFFDASIAFSGIQGSTVSLEH